MRKNPISANTTMTFPLRYDSLDLYFEGEEATDFKKYASFLCPDFDLSFFNLTDYEEIKKLAQKYNYGSHQITILSSILIITVPLNIEGQDNKVINPKSFKFYFEDGEFDKASVQYEFNVEMTPPQKLAVMVSILKQSIKENENFKFNFLTNGLKKIYDISFIEREGLNENFLRQSIEHNLENIRLEDVLTIDADISHLTFHKKRLRFEVNYPEKMNGTVRHFIFKKYGDDFRCTSLEFTDEKRKSIDVKKEDERLEFHYETDFCKMNFYGDNDYLIFKYKDNVYPKQFDRFLLSNDIFSVFDLRDYVKGLKYFDVFDEHCKLPEIYRGVLNILIKKGHQDYLEEVIDKNIDNTLSVSDYELLKMNFEMLTHYEKMYESLLPKLDIFMRSCDRFGPDVGSDKHLNYLKKKFGDEDGDN